MTVGSPTVDQNGVQYYPVKSIYQGSQQQIIRVLQPTNPTPGVPRRILYVLPVDSGVDTVSSTYSDGLEQLRLLDAQDQYNMVLIAPSFGYVPWYGDNTADAKQMESFLVDDLVPWGDTFGQGTVPQRYLIGFSKSGNGAADLIFRHPGVFNGAAIWDAPVETNTITADTGLITNFGTQANFKPYIIPNLVTSNAGPFKGQTRLWVSGDQAAFQAQMINFENQLAAASIPNIWVQGGVRAHSWASGWLSGALSGLSTIATQTPIAPSAGTLPPPRSGGLPSGVLAATTTQATLSLFTDDNATCRYGTTAGAGYGSIPNTFTTTGTTTHSTVVTGLVSGNTYTYYVRCRDAAGHTNADDYAITFTVSGTVASVSSTFSGTEQVLSENGLWDTPGAWQIISKSNGANSTATSGARVTNPLFGADQFSEITYSKDPGTNWVGVMTRIQGPTNGSGYLAFAFNEAVYLYRVDDNGNLNWTLLVSAGVNAGAAPRDLRLESQGNTLRVIFNGSLLISYTDPNNVYASGQPGIAAANFSSIVSFVGGTLPPAPVRSAGAPTGVLPATTTQATVSLATNENATCRYATTPGVAYAAMTNTFTLTGGTTDSTVVTGLVSNGNYSYYVRCQDNAGNTNTYDYAISFTVSSTASSGSSTFSGTAPILSDGGLWQSAPGSWGSMSENNGASAIGTDAAMMRNPLVGANQYAEITYSHDPGTSGWAGVMTRMQGASNGGGYLAFVYNGAVWLYRVDDNGGGSLVWNDLVSASVNVGTAPRDLRLESVGNTHTVIFNGSALITYTDPNNTYSTGQPGIAAATYSSILTFAGGTLYPAPVRTAGAPTGVLPATTTQATVSLVTNENATCKYSATPGVAYASMTNTFSVTGGTTQSMVVSGLVSGGNYNYYVRCQDSGGNTDTYDYAISFTVSSTATSASSAFSGTAAVLSDNGLWQTPVGSFAAMGENNGAYAVGTDAAMVRNPLLGPDEYSEITYSQDPGTSGWAGAMTRMQGASNGSGYLAFVYNGSVYFYRVDDHGSGAFTWNYLVAVSANLGTAPRDLRLESQGSTHRVFLNGSLLITYTDANNTYSSGQPGIAAATYSSILTFAGGNLYPAPVLSQGQPTGVLPATTTQATLSLVTNENATCKYSTTPGIAFASMANTFGTTGGTTHSTLLTGLVSGGNYNFYVRCQDPAGNTDSSDYAISFAVSSTATNVSSTFSGTATVLSDNGLWQSPVGSFGAMSENNGASAAGTDAAMVKNPMLGPDEYAEITYSQDPGTSGWAGVMTRMQGATNGSGYLAFVYNGTVYLYRVDDNGTGSLAWNYLQAVSQNLGAAPRDLRLESRGNTHTVIFNGTVVITYTDSNNVYSSGQPGIAAATYGSILTFSGGNL